ncbi:hypothetical protein [Streptomyces sp. NPDC020742]|uniref:hypothetical protein n=1 Tax=unclassified Streptomyces TaxID=2593676 RepID=UPI0034098B57
MTTDDQGVRATAPRCDCGSTLDLRDVLLDSASGPCRSVTFCGRCAPYATESVPEGVARILARRAGLRLPDDPPTIRP